MSFSSDCPHSTLMKDMCADCGADLRMEDSEDKSSTSANDASAGNPSGAGDKAKASISMVHSIPELKVSNDVSGKYEIILRKRDFFNFFLALLRSLKVWALRTR